MDRWRFDESEATTWAEAAVFRLKRDILAGGLAPNERLRVSDLSRRYKIGTSPMREALARLSESGFVRLEGQKGFRVTSISQSDLRGITATRQIVETEALGLAIQAADDFWEAEILKSFHLMKAELSRRGKGSRAWLDEFEARHHAFHRALIAACPLTPLKTFCEHLYLRMERYRRLLFGYAFDKIDVILEHEELMNVVLSRNTIRANFELEKHIALTYDLLSGLLTKWDHDRHEIQSSEMTGLSGA